MDVLKFAMLAVAIYVTIPALVVEAARSHKEYDVPAYFAFGDSLADVGTNNYLPQATSKANFPPYGETFFKKPTGRFTNGRNIVDFIAQALELPFAPPFLQPNASFTKGVNFASAGSGLLDSTNNGTVVSMSVQLQQYASVKTALQNQLGDSETEKLISESIFLIVSGSNDLIGGYLSKPELQKQINATQYISLVIEAYKVTLIDLYNSGARKALAVGLGPIGCAPLLRAQNPSKPGECLSEGNLLAQGFNAGLRTLVDALRLAFPGFNLVLADTFDPTYAMITEGESFGLTTVNSSCCGAGFLNAEVQCGKPVPQSLTGAQAFLCKRPYKFLFWDVLHPTEHAVRTLFKNVWGGNSTVAYPINLRALAFL